MAASRPVCIRPVSHGGDGTRGARSRDPTTPKLHPSLRDRTAGGTYSVVQDFDFNVEQLKTTIPRAHP